MLNLDQIERGLLDFKKLNDGIIKNRVTIRLRMVIVWLFFLISTMVFSADAAHQGTKLHSKPLTFRVAHCLSSSVELSEIANGDHKNGFSSEEQSSIEVQNGCAATWLSFEQAKYSGVIDFGTLVDKVTLLVSNRETGVVIWRSEAGDQLAANTRLLPAVHIAFPVPESGTTEDLYAKIEHSGQLLIQPRLVKNSEFIQRESEALAVHMWFAGAATVMAIFNLCLGLLLRKNLFVYYAFFVLSLVLSNMVFTGLGAAYLWPDLDHATNTIREISMVSSALFAGMMFAAFLEGCDEQKAIRIGIVFPTISVVVIATVWWLLDKQLAHTIISMWIGAVILSFVVTIAILARRNIVTAKLLLPSLILICLPVFYGLLIPKNSPHELAIGFFAIRYVFPVNHYFEVIVFLDSLLFSLLFAYRIRFAESEAFRVTNEMANLEQSISQRIIETIDAERKRMAADLHDTAGQGLLTITTRLNQFLKVSVLSPTEKSTIAQTASYSHRVVNDIRRISHDLHPAILDHIGWRAAIEELYENLAANVRFSTSVEIDVADEMLTNFQQMHLYRITQEMVSNTAKYSQSQTHRARFFQSGSMIIAQFIEDAEFNMISLDDKSPSSLGHIIIEQRVLSLKGKRSISTEGGYTKIMIEIPIIKPQWGGRTP